MSILEALAIWRRVKPWLEKPWVKSILGFLAKLFNAPAEKKDAKGWTETGRKTFDSRIDPKD